MAALVRLLREAPGSPEALTGAVTGVDFGALVEASARHGLSGLVRHLLEQARVEVPPPHGEALRRQAMAIAAGGLKNKRLLLLSLDALRAEGVVPVALKGYGLALRLYPDPLQRASTDVDLWVERAELERAQRALEGLGLSRGKSQGNLDEDALHHLELYGPAGMVELHYRALSSFGAPLEGGSFRERALGRELEGRPVRYLKPEDELVYLAVHATHHLLQRLSWLYDLKLLVDRHPGLDWDEVVQTARGTRMGGLAYFALAAAQRLLGARVPAVALSALRPSRWQAAVAREFFSEDRLEEAYLARHRPVWFLAKTLLTQDVPKLARLGVLRLWQSVRSRGGRR